MRQRVWIPTAVMAGVAALVIAFILLVAPHLEPPAEETGSSPTPAPFWEFESGEIKQITARKGIQTTTVERSDMTWRVVEPLASEADSVRLETLAYQTSVMAYTGVLEGEPETFGFTLEIATQVVLVLNDGTAVEFAIGDENPGRTSRYVKKPGDPQIYLVPTSYVNGLVEMVVNPPYPPTPAPPTPEPSPLGTPEPSPPAETATPEPSPAPTVTPTPTMTPRPTSTPKPTATPTS